MTSTPQILNEEILDRHVNAAAGIQRSKLEKTAKLFPIALELLRIFDAYQTNLPTTAASDDLGLIIGTLGTDAVVVQTSDAKNTTVTQKARFRVALPYNYVSGETISIVVIAGMKTTVANGTATIDFSAYKKDTATGLVGSDLVTTSATSINSLTPTTFRFTITPTSLVANDEFDILVTIAITDTATGTAVIGRIMQLSIEADVKG